jgi:pimeloyl-ACP methyl ester carboxylesterase
MPVLSLPEATLHYEIGGSGPPLLLVAGMASDSASWAPLVPRLEQDFTVVRPDNRSTGRTAPTDAPASVPVWARDAVALLDHLGIERAPVIGHSLGGIIALQMALDAPHRLSRLVLLASAPLRLPRNDALFALMVALRAPGLPPDLWLRAFLPWLFHPRLFEDPAQPDSAIAQSLAYPHAQTAAAMAHQARTLAGFDPRPLLAGPTVPVLALLARDDLLFPVDTARTALSAFSDLRLVTLPDVGHSLHWEAPDAVLGHVLPFLLAERPMP